MKNPRLDMKPEMLGTPTTCTARVSANNLAARLVNLNDLAYWYFPKPKYWTKTASLLIQGIASGSATKNIGITIYGAYHNTDATSVHTQTTATALVNKNSLYEYTIELPSNSIYTIVIIEVKALEALTVNLDINSCMIRFN